MTSNQVTSLADMRKNGGHWFIYLFFGIHMLMFGLSGFFMAYSSDGPGLGMVYMHGGIAILVYMVISPLLSGQIKARQIQVVQEKVAPNLPSGDQG